MADAPTHTHPGRGSRGLTYHLHLWVSPDIAEAVRAHKLRTGLPSVADAWRDYLTAGHRALTAEDDPA